MKLKKWIAVLLVFLLLLTGAFFYFLKRSNSFDRTKYIAKVNGEGILKSDYEKELAKSRHFFLWAKQDLKNIPSLENDVLNKMIDLALINQYTKKKGIEISDEEVNNYFVQYLAGKNQTEEEYLQKIKEMYGSSKEDVLKTIANDLLKEKVQSAAGKPLKESLAEKRASSKTIR